MGDQRRSRQGVGSLFYPGPGAAARRCIMNGASREGVCWEGVSQAEGKVCTEALSEWTEAQWGLSISKEAGVGGAE